MKIEMETKKVLYHTLSYHEWGRVVNEFYKPTSKWDFVSDHEAYNDSDYSFDVDGKIEDYEEKELEAFKRGSSNVDRMTQILLDDLCRQGLISKGVYLIEVCW